MRERYEELMDEAYYLPYGNSKVALLEEAVRIADADLTPQDAYYARMDLTEAATMSGKMEKAIVSFAWCLSYYDSQKSNNFYGILWHYKWICDHLKDFPEIQLEKIEASFSDYQKRLQASGYGLRSYYKLRRSFAVHQGHEEDVTRYYQLWINASDDGMTDCRACEINSQVSALLREGEFEQAYQLAEPIFSGRLSCRSVPQGTYSMFLLPLLEQKRYEDADHFYQKSRELLDYTQLSSVIEVLEYLTVVDLPKAVAWFEEFFLEAWASYVPSTRYSFSRASILLFEQLNDQQIRSIQFPDGVSPASIKQELYDIAQRFDQRNQNEKFVAGIERKRVKLQDLRSDCSKL